MNTSEIKKKVEVDGLFFLEEKMSPGLCKEIISFIDNYDIISDDKDRELLYSGTEMRIWDAHLKNEKIAEFKKMSDELLSEIYNKQIVSYTVLALKNQPIQNNPNDIVGRWHTDSFKTQIKVFTYLSEVTNESGPLELIKNTHTNSFKYKNVIKGNYFSVSDIFTGKRKYQRLDEIFIDSVAAKNGITPIICDCGTTAIVDTSSIHRARPCLKGTRYYLATYYRHF